MMDPMDYRCMNRHVPMDLPSEQLAKLQLPNELLLPMALPMHRVKDQRQLASIRLRCIRPKPIWLQKQWTAKFEMQPID